MRNKSLQPGDSHTLKGLGLMVGSLILIMLVCIGIALIF